MPATGPSKEFADYQGKEATEEIMALLKTKYGVNPPHPEIGSAKFREDWHKAAQQLQAAVQELIWADHCASF